MSANNAYHHIFSVDQPESSDAERIIGLGSFDGVHIGHRALVNRLLEIAAERGLRPAVITFNPLPVQYFTDYQVRILTHMHQRIELLHQAGVIDVIMLDFLKIKSMSPGEYLDYLANELKAKYLVLGADHRYGEHAKGDLDLMRAWAIEQEIGLEIIDFIQADEVKVASSQIRDLLKSGQINKANHLLGYKYYLDVEKVSGAGLGQELTVPTRNYPYPEGKVMIPQGVYAARLNGIACALNYGLAPTLKDLSEPILEVHLLGEYIETGELDRLKIIEHIRPEKKFSSAKKLKQQIEVDLEKIKGILV